MIATAPERPRLRILLADDHPVVLAGIRTLVAADLGMEVIGQAHDGSTALEMACTLRPDIAVIDISMPGMMGTLLTERLRQSCPDCRIVVLTVHEDRGYLRQMFEAGVSGYVLKGSAAEELVKALRIVAAGGLYIDPTLAPRAFGRGSGPSDPSAPAPSVELSAREVEVLRLLAEGHSIKAVAARLEIAVKTIETYKARAFEKLGFQSRVELIRYAVREGWLRRE